MSIIITSPELAPIANISLFDICQATAVNSCDPLFKATETNDNLLQSKQQTYALCLKSDSKDFPLLVK
jgi:hypothetical protein